MTISVAFPQQGADIGHLQSGEVHLFVQDYLVWRLDIESEAVADQSDMCDFRYILDGKKEHFITVTVADLHQDNRFVFG